MSSFNGYEEMPRSEWDYFIKYQYGRGFSMTQRVPEDVTVGDFMDGLKKRVKGIYNVSITTEWKNLTKALMEGLAGKRVRQDKVDRGGTEWDIIMGTRRFE